MKTGLHPRRVHGRFGATRFLLALCLIATGPAVFGQLPAGPSRPPTEKEIALGYRLDRLIAKPRPAARQGGVLRAAAARLRATVGVTVDREFPRLAELQVLKTARGDPMAKLAALRASGLYEYVEPDWIVRAFVQPNDPRLATGELWNLHNTGQSGGTNDADIDAPEGWDIRQGAPNVIVAVIDTGLNYTHQDIADNLWRNPGESGGGKETNGIDDDGNGWIDDVFGIDAVNGDADPRDDNSHGSHCAGIIAARGNNGLGGVGVAWQAQIMALKFLDASGTGSDSDAITCIDYARAKGAHILSNSWGGGFFSQSLKDAFAAARDAGIIVVAAAGNEASNNDTARIYPSNFELDNIVSVASTTRNDALSTFSNFGFGFVDLGAPGSDILSLSHATDSSYEFKSGTSMATPHVAGALALLKAQFPGDTYRQLINRLLRHVDPIPALDGKTQTGGRLNIAGSLAATLNTPFNDDLANAAMVASGALDIRGSNRDATREIGEPNHAGDASQNASLWWLWTAATTGPVSVDTTGSDFDTLLAVYTGNTYPGLNLVASNDDGVSGTASELTFVATGGVTYAFAVAGKAGATGFVRLKLASPPANDDFSGAVPLSGFAVDVTGSNRGGSKEPGEPNHAANVGGRSVWWTWTAPTSQIYTLDTVESDFDTLVGIYTGSAVNALTLVAENDDARPDGTSRAQFTAAAGTTYWMAIDGKNGASGSITFQLSAPPENDDFSDRAVLANNVAGSNVGASREPGEPDHANGGGSKSVWWTWTAPSTGEFEFDTAGSSYDTLLAVYTGTAVDALTLLAGNDDSVGSLTSRVTISATAGTAYQIAVDGFHGDSGAITLAVNELVPPDNDLFAARLPLANAATGSNVYATAEPGEPNIGGVSGGATVWWTWTPAVTQTCIINTNGSNFDTTLGVYTGASPDALTTIVTDDDLGLGLASRVTFTANAGVPYQIVVDGYNGDEGSISLQRNGAPFAVADAFLDVVPGTPTMLDVQANDSDPDGEAVTIIGLSATPVDASVTHDGTTVTFNGGATLANTGVNTFKYTISDGAGGETTGSVTIYRSRIYQWRAENFAANAANLTVAGDLADPNFNGLGNLLEYALGGSPTSFLSGVAILPVVRRNLGTNRLELLFDRHLDRTDLLLEVLAADSPAGPWEVLATSTGGGAFVPVAPGAAVDEPPAGQIRRVTISDRYPLNDPLHWKRFLRLGVTRQ